jgi:Transposase DDE domain
MFADPTRCRVWDQLRGHDSRLLGRFLTPQLLRQAAARTGLALGRGPLHLLNLVWLGLLAALHTGKNFADILTLTLKLLSDQEGFGATPLGRARRRRPRRRGRRAKHDPRRDDPTQVSEEAFTKARRLMPLAYWTSLLVLLGERFQAAHGQRNRWHGLRLLALDGTCIDLDHWPKLRAYFGTTKNAHGCHNVQARLTLLQLPLTRLPYAYEVGPLAVGEVTMASRLVARLQANDLVLFDRGFFSYGLFWQVHRRGAFFAVRLRPGIRLRRRRRLGPGDAWVRWQPKDSRGQWRKQGLPRAIDLRLIRYRVPGFRADALLTNLTNPRRVRWQDWVGLAAGSEVGRPLQSGLYRRRWEIETTFAELKVSQGMEGGLRSRTPQGVQYEIASHVLLYLLVRWLMVEAAVAQGRKDALRLSFVEALRELLDVWESLLIAGPWWACHVLIPRLLERVAQHEVPLRPGRSFPRRKDQKAQRHQSNPKRRPATKNQG